LLLAGGADLTGVLERMGNTQFQTTQTYQHTLPDTDQKNLDAFSRVADRGIQVTPPRRTEALSGHQLQSQPVFAHEAITLLAMPAEFDIYLSHAWEDKARVKPLVDGLRAEGLRVWYDDDELESGRSLRQQLDEGVQRSEVGMVILSHAFFAPNKYWAPLEFDMWMEAAPDRKSRLVLIWLDVTKDEVKAWSPSAATLFAWYFTSPDLVDRVTSEVQAKMIRNGRFGAYLRTNLERNLEWVRPPQVFHDSLRLLDEDPSWSQEEELSASPRATTPPLARLFEGAGDFEAQPVLLTGRQVWQQSLAGNPKWQEFAIQLVTNQAGYERCLAMVHFAKTSARRLTVPRPPDGHIPLVQGLVVATGGVLFGDSVWQTVLVQGRDLTYFSIPPGSPEPSSVHWPTDFPVNE
jgi:hypothetical protein